MIAGRSFAASMAALMILTAFAIAPARAAGPFLFDVMKQPAYRKAYLAIFAGAKDLPPWLKEITGKSDYVTAPADKVTIGGVTYLLFNACKPHGCDTDALEVMFGPGGAPAYALLIEGEKPKRWFGNPNVEQQAVLLKPFQ
jgi:hypothetical protein